jgi:hypothetical protein
MNDEYPEGWRNGLPSGFLPKPAAQVEKMNKTFVVVVVGFLIVCGVLAILLPIVGLILFVAASYFLPFIIAAVRNHRNAPAIFLLNLLLGWTLLGWIGALIWAVHKDK